MSVVDSYAASTVILEWGDNSLELKFPEPVLIFAEIAEAVQRRFPGIKPIGQYLEKGICRVVFREEDFSPYERVMK